MNLDLKHKELEATLSEMDSVLIAYSGGVDSALVLAVAQSVLGNKVLAVTADSPSVPRSELQAAREFAHSLGARHKVIRTRETDSPDYAGNPINRCYFCKSELYGRLQPVLESESLRWIVNGTNRDDLGDYRPGLQSAEENRVRSPLVEAGFDKSDVRALSKKLGLITWNKPAMPCLASRIPYGQNVTTDKLRMIEEAEAFIRTLGYREIRVRHLGESARVELDPDELQQILARKQFPAVEARLKQIGFQHVRLDEEGYRSGRLNEGLSPASQRKGNHVSF